MAREAPNAGPERVYILTPSEAVEMIAFLSAQLADVPAPNSQMGALPVLKVTKNGAIIEKLTFVVNTTSENDG